MINDHIKEICEEPDAKGSLIHAVKNGHWNKPEDVGIPDHNLRIQQLL